jgi:hypothetical protein
VLAALAIAAMRPPFVWCNETLTFEATQISIRTTQGRVVGADLSGGFVETGSEAWQAFRSWVLASYERAPALVLGLAALIAVPPLAMIGLLFRGRARAAPDVTYIQTRKRRVGSAGGESGTSPTERVPAWPSAAWIEIEGPVEGRAGVRHGIGRGVVRIGREGDNDICLTDQTVHRYHAAIHRTDDAEFVITDLSSAGGNGVTVNGRRISEARLRDGDRIELGLARLRFIAKPA